MNEDNGKKSITPSKDTNSHFIPKEFSSPNKDHSGITKTIFTHISNLHSLLNDWDKLQTKGKKICRSISSIKLHEFQDDYYPHDVKVLVETLVQVVDGLEVIVQATELLKKQIEALAKIQPSDTPVMQTWTAKQISECVSMLNELLLKELKLKKTILENIAHCRDEHLMEVYTSAWEYNLYLDNKKFLYLFIEFGITI